MEAREEKKAGSDGKPAAQESLVSLLVNDCLKWVAGCLFSCVCVAWWALKRGVRTEGVQGRALECRMATTRASSGHAADSSSESCGVA